MKKIFLFLSISRIIFLNSTSTWQENYRFRPEIYARNYGEPKESRGFFQITIQEQESALFHFVPESPIGQKVLDWWARRQENVHPPEYWIEQYEAAARAKGCNLSIFKWHPASREKLFNYFEGYQINGYRQMLEMFPEFQRQMYLVSKKIENDNNPILEKIKFEGKTLREYITKEGEFYIRDRQRSFENIYQGNERANKAALKARQEASKKWGFQSQTFNLDEKTKRFLVEAEIDKSIFELAYGTPLQIQLHKEFVDITKNCATQYFQVHEQLKPMYQNIGKYAEVGCKAAQNKQIEAAGFLAEFCRHTYAFVSGAYKACHDNIEALSETLAHPIRTAQELASLAGKAITAYVRASFESDLIDHYTVTYLLDGQIPETEVYREASKSFAGFGETLESFYKSVSNMSSEETCENAGYLITDGLINFWALPQGASYATQKVSQAITRGKKTLQGFGVVGEQSSKLVGLAGIEGPVRASKIMDKAEVFKQKNPEAFFPKAKKAVDSHKTIKRVSASELTKVDPTKHTGIIKKNSITLKEAGFTHAYSDKHVSKGIDLFGERDKVTKEVLTIIQKADGLKLVQEGTNQIKCHFNNELMEIRFRVEDGELISFNFFREWSDRHIQNKIFLEGNL